MRNSFVRSLVKEAEHNQAIQLLCGDLGFSVLDDFAAKYPDRYLNVGIAEQNMMGLAAGLALYGHHVFTYSIVNFAIARCLEQIRNDICYHQLNVTMVAVGGGTAYGTHGYTHQGVEDLAMTRSLPHIRVFSPADEVEMRYCMQLILQQPGPSYLRLARGGEPVIHQQEIPTDTGLICLQPMQDITFLVMGTPLAEAVAAAQELKEKGISVGLYSVPYLSIDLKDEIQSLAQQCTHLITVEEHLITGGLGTYISEYISELPGHAQLIRKGITHQGLNKSGSQSYLRTMNGIDQKALIQSVEMLLR